MNKEDTPYTYEELTKEFWKDEDEIIKLNRELDVSIKVAKSLAQDLENSTNKIDKAIEYMEHYIEVEDAPINERIKIEFEYVINILRGEDNE